MKIERLKKLKNNKYEILLDNNIKIVLYEEVIIDNNLLYKKDIDIKLLEELEKQNEYYDNYNRVVKYCMRKLRSEAEIDEFLKKLDVSKIYKDKIKEKLKSLKLLDDYAYAEAFIYDKINLTNDGPLKIKKELSIKKIDDDIINKILNNYDQTIFIDKLTHMIGKKKNTKYSNYMFKNKLLTYFINLGYEKDMIVPILDQIDSDVSLIIKKDYDMILSKLSKKYSDEKLEYEVKKKLYQKGYSIDDINNIKKGY